MGTQRNIMRPSVHHLLTEALKHYEEMAAKKLKIKNAKQYLLFSVVPCGHERMHVNLALGEHLHLECAGCKPIHAAFVAWHTVSNFYYLVAPTRGGRPARDFVLDLLRFVEVAPATTTGLRKATRLPLKDFEDAMQVVAAEACDADAIATRNVRDFAKASVRAMRPRDLLREIA